MYLESKKLVILGIPWDVDTDELRQYMSQFGELTDAMVMKDRASGRSRGFGYVTFSSSEDAKEALSAQHTFKGRMLEVKVATPKEEMVSAAKRTARIFVARIPSNVTNEDFCSYFKKYGPVIDAYMPKEPVTKQHRGIGFVTYENSESVDKLMSETHELGGSMIAVDRATPKEASRVSRSSRNFPKIPCAHSLFNSSGCNDIHYSGSQSDRLLSSAACSAQDAVGSDSGQVSVSAPARKGKKMFIGRVPAEATTEDLHAYFSQFGWVLDVYLPKDAKKSSHRGFGFVTFADEASAARVARLRHYLFGREIAVESASPTDQMHGVGHVPAFELSSLAGGKTLPSDVPGLATENCKTDMSSTSSTGKWGKKIFIGRIPLGATAIDLRLHFSQFGHVMDVYLPKDERKTSHRGFGFVTFADEISAEYASQKIHKILGEKIILDRAAPLEIQDSNTTCLMRSDGSLATLQNLSSQQGYDAKGVQSGGASGIWPPRSALRFKPY